MRSGRIFIAVILAVVAIAAIAAGVVYLTVPPHSLPTFFPGHTTTKLHKPTLWKKGTAGVVFGVVLAAAVFALIATGRRRPRWN